MRRAVNSSFQLTAFVGVVGRGFAGVAETEVMTEVMFDVTSDDLASVVGFAVTAVVGTAETSVKADVTLVNMAPDVFVIVLLECLLTLFS